VRNPREHPDRRTIDELNLLEIECHIAPFGKFALEERVEIPGPRQIQLSGELELGGSDLLDEQLIHVVASRGQPRGEGSLLELLRRQTPVFQIFRLVATQ
jgi:hypothetical protein